MLVKVGLSKNIAHRVPRLQVGNPRTLALVAFKGPYKTRREARAIELLVHNILIDSHVGGEWFEIDDVPDIFTMGAVPPRGYIVYVLAETSLRGGRLNAEPNEILPIGWCTGSEHHHT